MQEAPFFEGLFVCLEGAFMKLFFFLFLGIFSFSSAFASGCPQHYFKGLQPTLTNQKMSVKTTELCSSDYVVLHSGVVRIPLYAAEHLTRARLGQAKGLPRHDNFRPDPRLLTSKLKSLTRS